MKKLKIIMMLLIFQSMTGCIIVSHRMGGFSNCQTNNKNYFFEQQRGYKRYKGK
jgi:hypothetical protein